MIICSVEAELFRVDRRTAGHDEANGRFSQFCKRAQKCLETSVKFQIRVIITIVKVISL